MKPIPRIRSITVRTRMALRRSFTKALKEIAAKAVAELDTTEKASSSKRKQIDGIVVSVMDEEFENGIGDALAIVATDGVSLAMAQIGGTSDDILAQANDDAVRWAKAHSAEMVTNVSDTTKEALADLISKAIAEGWSNDTLAEEIETNFKMSPERADMIARTETAAADVQGNRVAYEASGLVDSWQWLTAGDEKVSDECISNNGEIRKLGEAFPSGATEVPGHPLCRCDMLPVFRKDEDE